MRYLRAGASASPRASSASRVGVKRAFFGRCTELLAEDFDNYSLRLLRRVNNLLIDYDWNPAYSTDYDALEPHSVLGYGANLLNCQARARFATVIGEKGERT
jgi:hypothetical protein